MKPELSFALPLREISSFLTVDLQERYTPDDLLRRIEVNADSLYRTEDAVRIKRMANLAVRAHEGQKRGTGDEYATHPLIGGYFLMLMGLRPSTVIEAFGHDFREDTEVTADDIVAEVYDGEQSEEAVRVIKTIEDLTKLKGTNITYQAAENAHIRTIIKSIIENPEAVVVKCLADRPHNAHTLAGLPEEKRLPYAIQTVEIFTALGHIIGEHAIADWMGDVAVPQVNEDYKSICRDITETIQSSDQQQWYEELHDVFSLVGYACTVYQPSVHNVFTECGGDIRTYDRSKIVPLIELVHPHDSDYWMRDAILKLREIGLLDQVQLDEFSDKEQLDRLRDGSPWLQVRGFYDKQPILFRIMSKKTKQLRGVPLTDLLLYNPSNNTKIETRIQAAKQKHEYLTNSLSPILEHSPEDVSAPLLAILEIPPHDYHLVHIVEERGDESPIVAKIGSSLSDALIERYPERWMYIAGATVNGIYTTNLEIPVTDRNRITAEFTDRINPDLLFSVRTHLWEKNFLRSQLTILMEKNETIKNHIKRNGLMYLKTLYASRYSSELYITPDFLEDELRGLGISSEELMINAGLDDLGSNGDSYFELLHRTNREVPVIVIEPPTDREGLTADITGKASKLNINLLSVQSESLGKHFPPIITLVLSPIPVETLHEFLDTIKQIDEKFVVRHSPYSDTQ